MVYSGRVLKMGQCDVPGPEVCWMSHWDEWYTLAFYMTVIQGGGKTAIINTGPPADLVPLNEVWRHFAGDRCQMVRQESERPIAALAAPACGVRSAERTTAGQQRALRSAQLRSVPWRDSARRCTGAWLQQANSVHRRLLRYQGGSGFTTIGPKTSWPRTMSSVRLPPAAAKYSAPSLLANLPSCPALATRKQPGICGWS